MNSYHFNIVFYNNKLSIQAISKENLNIELLIIKLFVYLLINSFNCKPTKIWIKLCKQM